MELLHAAPYEINGGWHNGKIHAIREGERTYCGNERRYTDGFIADGERGSVSCKGCIRSLDAADRSEQSAREWERRSAELAEQRQQERDEWWAQYSQYLQTPEWAQRRQLVLQRAGWLCEGCMAATASVIHHRTYEHVGHELLFELVALCRSCHQIAHPDKDLT